jgi:GNAT superfamily N-acetyltransferase
MPTIIPLPLTRLGDAAATLDAAFGHAGMMGSLRAAYTLQPENFFCALEHERVAGVVGAHDYGPFAAIGLMAVHPIWQGRGIGGALMGHLLDYLDGRGCRMQILDASAAGQPLYPKLGFQPEGDTLRMMRLAGPPTASIPDLLNPDGVENEPAPVSIAALKADALPALIAFDAPYFGARREAVLTAFVNNPAAETWGAYDASGALVGYLITAAGHIGPWTAAAPVAASALLAHALRAHALAHLPSANLFATVPSQNTAAAAMLAAAGFTEGERLLHMRRGGTADPRQPVHLYGQASLSLG